MGGAIESVCPVYFWYLALTAVGLLMLISLLGGLMRLSITKGDVLLKGTI